MRKSNLKIIDKLKNENTVAATEEDNSPAAAVP